MLTITEFIQENKINIDNEIFDLVYNIINNDEWIYLTKELVVEWLGYTDAKNAMSHFYTKLIKDFEENIEYKEVDKNNETIKQYIEKNNSDKKYGNRSKYYIVSNKTLILLLARAKQIKSLRILEHFYFIYDLLLKYHKYQSDELKIEYTNEIERIKNIEHNKLYTDTQVLKYIKLEEITIGVVYFIYEENDITCFKIGFTNNLEIRLARLQCGNKRVLRVYKYIECNNPSDEETKLHKKFNNKRIHGEWFKITIIEIDSYIHKYKSNKIITLIDNMDLLKL